MFPNRAASVVVPLPVVLFAQSNLPVPGHRAALGMSQPEVETPSKSSFSLSSFSLDTDGTASYARCVSGRLFHSSPDSTTPAVFQRVPDPRS
jgi:hypothetical protein